MPCRGRVVTNLFLVAPLHPPYHWPSTELGLTKCWLSEQGQAPEYKSDGQRKWIVSTDCGSTQLAPGQAVMPSEGIGDPSYSHPCPGSSLPTSPTCFQVPALSG